MKKLIALAMAMLMALSLVACGGGEDTEKTAIDKILEQGYITVAISPDFAPSEFKDPATGEILGTDVEFAQRIAEYIGKKYETTVELKIEEMDFKACQAAVATGVVDFSVNGYAKTDDRAASYYCAGPYAIIPPEEDTFHGALVKKGLEIKTAEDFIGLKVGAQLSSLQYELAAAQLPAEVVENIEFVTNLAQGALMVDTGKIDALITDSGAGELLIVNNDTLEMAEFRFEYYSEGNYALVNINETELGDLITEALTRINEEVNYSEMRQYYTDLAASLGWKNE